MEMVYVVYGYDVEIIMPSSNGGKWRIPIRSARKEKGRFVIEINNPF